MVGRLILAITALGAAIAASPADALETGQCLPASEVRSVLASEAMNPIVVGNRSGYGYPTSLIFFANADGSRGYLIRGDKPLGEQSDHACVESVYRNVRLNDVATPGVPRWSLMQGRDAAAANAICKRGGLGYQDKCNFHNDSIIGQERNGQRVMLVATGTAINPRDKIVRRDQTIVVTLNPSNGLGLVKATTVEGASYMLSAYARGSFTQFGDAVLRAAK